MATRRPFVGGNHKMNGTKESLTALLKHLNGASLDASGVEVVVAPPTILIPLGQSLVDRHIGVAAQNCHEKLSGAFTGETSAAMLKDLGIEWVILGHSERRHVFGEKDAQMTLKVQTVQEVGIKAIVCIGEKLDEREANQTTAVCVRQLEAFAAGIKDWSRVVVAYEPVWAIGTGKTATPELAQEVHATVRGWLRDKVSPQLAASVRIIYGGSVTAANCVSLAAMADIDGFLVGGASLQGDGFVSIVKGAKKPSASL